MAETKESSNRAGAFWLLLKRALILLAVVAVCAAVPLLIKNHRAVNEANEQPPTIFDSIEPADPPANTNGTGPAAKTEDPGPTDDTVRQLAATVAGAGGRGYDLPVSANVGKVKTVPGPYQKLGQIQIPSVGLNVQYGEGVFEKTLNRGPGHWPGTPMPGSEGNTVLSGHRNTHTQPFKELDELRHGDKIVATYGKKKTTYRVFKTTIVPEAKFKDFVVRQPKNDGAREITLFACHPEGNPIFRIVVQAMADPLK